MPNETKEYGMISLFLILPILVVVGLIIFYLFKFGNFFPYIQSSISTKKVLSSEQPTKIASSSANKVITSQAESKYILEKKTDNGPEELFAISNIALFNIIRWNNLLIFSDGGQNDNNYPPDIKIKVHNLDSGVTNIIFDSKENIGQFDIQKFPDFLSDLKIVDNTLYFSLGGYLREGAIFWLDLPPVGKPQKLLTIRNGSISKLRNWYFVIGGEGDSCGSERDFYLLDLAKKTTKFIINSKYGCSEGQESLGITNDGKMIMAFHGSSVDAPSIGRYYDVTSLNISDLSNKQIIISREQMPPNVTTILYSENQNQLLLIGSSLFIYNFTESRLNKITDSPKEVRLYYTKEIWEKDKICLDGDNGAGYELDLNKGDLVKTSLSCGIMPSPVLNESTNFENLINLLKLPANYQLIQK